MAEHEVANIIAGRDGDLDWNLPVETDEDAARAVRVIEPPFVHGADDRSAVVSFAGMEGIAVYYPDGTPQPGDPALPKLRQTAPPVAAYQIGDRTMEHVFRANGITDVSDMQAVFDAVESALVQILARPVPYSPYVGGRFVP